MPCTIGAGESARDFFKWRIEMYARGGGGGCVVILVIDSGGGAVIDGFDWKGIVSAQHDIIVEC